MKYRWGVVAAIAVVIVAVLVFAIPRTITPETSGVAMDDLARMYPPENSALGQVVIKTYREYRANAARWSGVYFTCVFGSAFLSVLAAVVLKLELLQAWPRVRNDLAAIAAVLATLLITLSTTADFQRKWQANRLAAAAMENLAYDLVSPKTSAGLRAVIVEIQAINDARNMGIVGEQTTRHLAEAPLSQGVVKPNGSADALITEGATKQ